MQYVVTVQNLGNKFWLRGTTWAFDEGRANRFDTEDQAKEAAKKAEKFMAPAIKKGYRIEPIEG